jgi:AcrR family transcriptional regulator
MNAFAPEDTRKRLLKAALEVFAEQGYAAATVREICRRANANVAAVNYYFGDKKRLYTEIFDTVFQRLRSLHPPELPCSASPENRLRVFIRTFFEEVFYCEGGERECTHLGAMYLMEMAHPTEVLDEIVDRYIRGDAAELRSIVSDLLGSVADPMTVVNCAASVVGQVLYYYHAQPLIKRLHPDHPPAQQRIEELAEHVWSFSLGGLERLRQQVQSAQRTSQGSVHS